MSHIINALVLKGSYNKKEAEKYDLIGVDIGFGLTLFFIDDDYTSFWQNELNASGDLETNNSFPNKRVIFELMKRISKSSPIAYAAIATAYVGGMGDQYANVYQDDKNVDLSINTINGALQYLGVVSVGEEDEFDTVGLGRFRRNPEYLDKYSKRRS